MAQISDSLIQSYQNILSNYRKVATANNKFISDQEKANRVLKRRLFWSRCEIWGYRIGIVGGFIYFIAR